jgi:hypothetical protein
VPRDELHFAQIVILAATIEGVGLVQIFPLALGPELVDARAAQPDADAEGVVADIEQDDVGQDELQVRGIDVGPRRQPAGPHLRMPIGIEAGDAGRGDLRQRDVELVIVPRQCQGSAARALELDDLAFPLTVHGAPESLCAAGCGSSLPDPLSVCPVRPYHKGNSVRAKV